MKFISTIKKHRKALTALFLVGVIAIGAFSFARVHAKQAMAADVEPVVTTAEITRMDLSNSISITGTIAARESQTVYSNNSGCEVVSMNVAVGDYVEEGEVICMLDASDYEEKIADIQKSMSIASQKSALNVTQAERSLLEAQADASTDLERAQEKVNETIEDYNSVVDSKNDAYNTYLLAVEAREDKQEELEQLQTKVKNLKAKLADANDALLAAEQALADGTGDQAAADAAAQAVTEAQAKVDNYTSQVTAAKSEVEAAKNAESSAKTNYESYGDKLESAVRSYESAVQSQEDAATQSERSVTGKSDSLTSAGLDASTTNDDNEKQIEEYRKLVNKCTVTAPISGVVTSINIDVGDEIAQDNNEICVVQDNSGYKVEATVDQYDISSLYEGMEAVIKTDATEELEMQGTVTFVSPTPGTATGSGASASGSSETAYPIEIDIANPDEKLRIGMTAETSVLKETAENVFAVPYDCIEENESGESVIYVIDGDVPSQDVSENKAGRSQKAGRVAEKSVSGGQRAIVVETGLETDYYTEINSDDIKEGMQVIVPNSITQSSGESRESGSVNFNVGGGGMGGSPGGGMGGGPGGR